jgi:hypothetical protein
MIPELEAFEALMEKADAAGREAVANLKVTPMIVGQAKSLFSNEIDYTKPVEVVESGACGFAWISVYPEFKGNTRLGKQERAVLEEFEFEQDYCNKAKYTRWVSEFGQSLERKTAYANAAAAVFAAAGIRAFGQSRID